MYSKRSSTKRSSPSPDAKSEFSSPSDIKFFNSLPSEKWKYEGKQPAAGKKVEILTILEGIPFVTALFYVKKKTK